MDENKNPKALNEDGEEAIAEATPASETKATEEVKEPEVKAEPKEEVKAEEPKTETEEKPERKGLSKRVRQLNAKANEAEERATVAEENVKSLSDRVEELTGSVEPQAVIQPRQTPPQDQPIVAPGEEIDAIELDKRLKTREQASFRRTEALIELKSKQAGVINKVNQESVEALKTYPELDPDSDSFNRDLSDSVSAAVEAHIKAEPYKASVKNFVDKLMKPYKGAITKEVGKVTKTLAKQASQSAVKPTSVRKGEKSAEDKSISELEKDLGVVQG